MKKSSVIWRALAGTATTAILFGLASPIHAQSEIKGSGATFPAMVYSTWAFGYSKEKGVAVKYSPTGSGEGIRSISAREVDFGATDSPLSDEELGKQKLLQFPTLVGGIVPVVNLPGIASIKLTGPVLAAIFDSKIQTWNDPAIAALNPGARLPGLKISRIVRQDNSGTTEGFAHYLASVYPAWRGGTSRKVDWSGSVSAVKGNDGIAQAVKSTIGAIGYVSFDRVGKLGLTPVTLRNKAGQFVLPSEGAIAAAARASELRSNFRASVTNSEGSESWPIVDVTFILVDSRPKTAVDAARTLKFFYWAMLKGDEIVHGTGFAPLPVEVQARVVRMLASVEPQDGRAIELLGSRDLARIYVAAR